MTAERITLQGAEVSSEPATVERVTLQSGADTRFVGAPLYASSYPSHMLDGSGRCKTHVFMLVADAPVRVLCGKVSLDSYFEDTTQHVPPADVSCETCARRFTKLSSSDTSK